MKNKLKGFTLVELIVVMAILSIIMAGVMRLFDPIRSVYVDSTQYEMQRTAQNGIVRYITESVRYSTDMGIYSSTKVSGASADKAADEFVKQYCIYNGIVDKASGNPVAPYDSTEYNNIKNEIRKYAEIIIIANDDNNSHTYYNKKYTGRLIRRKFADPLSPTISADPSLKSAVPTNDWRIALSESYYGANTFSISLSVKDDDSDGYSDDGMLEISVASTRNGKRDISNVGKETTVTPNVTRGGVLCRNLVSSGSGGVNNAGLFDVSKYNTPGSPGTKSTPGSSVTSGTKTYIIFLNKDGKEQVEAVVEAAKATP